MMINVSLSSHFRPTLSLDRAKGEILGEILCKQSCQAHFLEAGPQISLPRLPAFAPKAVPHGPVAIRMLPAKSTKMDWHFEVRDIPIFR